MDIPPLKILLADDDPDDCDFFQFALQQAFPNHKLVTKSDGAKLMKYLKKLPDGLPDIIFLDINMPCMTGLDCLREIRENEEMMQIPIIMLSTSNFGNDIEESFKCGANRFICKRDFWEKRLTIMRKIFSDGWQQELFRRQKDTFVVNFMVYPDVSLKRKMIQTVGTSRKLCRQIRKNSQQLGKRRIDYYYYLEQFTELSQQRSQAIAGYLKASEQFDERQKSGFSSQKSAFSY